MAITINHFKPVNNWILDPRIKDCTVLNSQPSLIKDLSLRVQMLRCNLKQELSNCNSNLQTQKREIEVLSSDSEELAYEINQSSEIIDKETRISKIISDLRELDELFYDNGKIKHIMDESTGDLYLNESTWTIWKKGAALFFFSFLWIPCAIVETLSKRLAALSFGDQCLKQIVHIILLDWIILAMMFLSSIYTMISPGDGRKAFSTWARALQDGIESPSNLKPGPCFDPRIYGDGSRGSLLVHFGGGNEITQDAF